MQIKFKMNGESRTKTTHSEVDDLASSLHTLDIHVTNGAGGFNGADENGRDGCTENKANENENKANESGNEMFDSRISLPFPRFVDELESKSHCHSEDSKTETEAVAVQAIVHSTKDKESIDEKEAATSQVREEKESTGDGQTATAAADEEAHRERFVVRLRGLPWSAREPEIRAFFSEENVVEVQIVYLTDGRTSGEALVEFASDSSMVTAFLKNRQHIGHRYIEIFKSTPMELDTAAGRCSRPPACPPKSQFVIRMRGLPYSAMEHDVEMFFGNEPAPATIHLIKDDLGRPSGEGFVEFLTEVDAIEAMSKHRHHMGHRYIELFRSSPEELMRALGLTVGFLKQLHGDAGLKSTCVLMRGLPYSCTESDITKFFQEIEVTPIRIHRKADGAEAYVEFYSVADTDKAMTRHRNYIGRRYIELFRVSYEDMARTVGLPIASSPNPSTSIINHADVAATVASTMATPHQAHMTAHGGHPHAHHGHAHPVPQAMQHPMAGSMNMMVPSPYAYSLLSANRNAMQPNPMGGLGPQGMQGMQGIGNGMGSMANVPSTPFGPPTMHPMAGPTTPNTVPPPSGPPSYYAPGPQYYQQLGQENQF